MICNVCTEKVDACEECFTKIEGDFYCFEEVHFCSVSCWEKWLIKEEKSKLEAARDDGT